MTEYSSQVTADTAVVTTNETIAATVPGVSTPRAGVKIELEGFLQLTTGANTTGITVRVRRGAAITDPVVAEANVEQVEAAAGSTEGHEVFFEDTPGEVAGQTYVLTVQQAAATTNGSVVFARLKAKTQE